MSNSTLFDPKLLKRARALLEGETKELSPQVVRLLTTLEDGVRCDFEERLEAEKQQLKKAQQKDMDLLKESNKKEIEKLTKDWLSRNVWLQSQLESQQQQRNSIEPSPGPGYIAWLQSQATYHQQAAQSLFTAMSSKLTEIDSLREESEEKDGIIESKDAEIATMKSMIEGNKSKLQELKQQLQAHLTSQKQSLQASYFDRDEKAGEIESKDQEIEKLQECLQQSEATIESKDAKISELRQVLEDHQSELEEARDSIEQFKERISAADTETLQNTLREKDTMIKSKDADIVTLQKTVEKNKEDIIKLQKRNQVNNAEMSELREENEENREKAGDAVKRLLTLRQIYADDTEVLRSDREKKADEIESKDQEIKKLQECLQQSEATIESKDAKISELRQVLEDHQSELEEARDSIEQFKERISAADIESLQNALREKDTMIKSKDADIVTLQKTVEKNKEDIIELQKRNQVNNAEMSELREENEENREKAGDAVKRLLALRQIYADDTEVLRKALEKAQMHREKATEPKGELTAQQAGEIERLQELAKQYEDVVKSKNSEIASLTVRIVQNTVGCEMMEEDRNNNIEVIKSKDAEIRSLQSTLQRKNDINKMKNAEIEQDRVALQTLKSEFGALKKAHVELKNAHADEIESLKTTHVHQMDDMKRSFTGLSDHIRELTQLAENCKARSAKPTAVDQGTQTPTRVKKRGRAAKPSLKAFDWSAFDPTAPITHPYQHTLLEIYNAKRSREEEDSKMPAQKKQKSHHGDESSGRDEAG